MVWHNWMGVPWEDVLLPTSVRWVSAGVLILAGLAILLTLRQRNTQTRLAADLFWVIAAGTGLTLAFWLINSKIHPRYLISLSGPLYILLGWLIVALWRGSSLMRRSVASILLLMLIAVSSMGTRDLYAAPTAGFRHDETRALAAYLRENFDADDAILSLDPWDYTLGYYDTGAASLFRVGLDEGFNSEDDLLEFLAGKDEIAVVRFHAERSDKRRMMPFYLERYGRRTGSHGVHGYRVETYQLDGDTFATAMFDSATGSWDQLTLTGANIHSGDAITVALQWEIGADFATDRRISTVLRLTDPETDWLLAETGGLLFSESGRTSEGWNPGEVITRYYVLPLVPGTPRIDTDLSLTLLDADTGEALEARDEAGSPIGDRVSLGPVTLVDAPETWVYEVTPPITLTSMDNNVLNGYALDQTEISPGARFGLTLRWTMPPEEVAQAATIQLLQGDEVIAESSGPPLDGRIPASASPWLDRRLLTVSRDAENGSARLVLSNDDEILELAEVTIAGIPRIMEPPPISQPVEASFGSVELVGYEVNTPDDPTSEDTITITLVWHVLEDIPPDINAVFFGHMLAANGHLVGQHDGVPVFGARPIGTWQAGEYIIDEHPMTFREDHAGPITIQVGLYDPDTFERWLAADGADAVRLPTTLDILPRE